MKTKELKAMDGAKLSEHLLEIKKELMKEQSQRSTGATSKSPKKIRQLKKNIAQIYTFMTHESMAGKTTKKTGGPTP